MAGPAFILPLVERVGPKVRGGGTRAPATSTPTPPLRSDPPHEGEGMVPFRWSLS